MSCGCTDPCQPNSIPCTCEARVTSDCVTVSGATSNCLAIDDNLLLTDYLTQMDERICEKVDSVTNFIALENVGTGSQLYKGDSLLGKKQIRTVKSLDSALIVTETVDEIQLDLNLPAIVPPDGTETKLVSGTNTTVAGNGSTATPYSVNVTLDGSETKVIAGTNTTVAGNGTTATPYVVNFSGITSINDATSSIKGILKLTNDLGGTADAPTTPTAVHKTGNESFTGIKSVINNGSSLINGLFLTNDGTNTDGVLKIINNNSGIGFYANVVNGSGLKLDLANSSKGIEIYNSSNSLGMYIAQSGAGFGLRIANFSTTFGSNMEFIAPTVGNGDLIQFKSGGSGNPILSKIDKNGRFIILGGTSTQMLMADGSVKENQDNLQRVITTSTVILDIDNNNTIFINNGATPITITIDSSITLPNFCVGFIQEGTGDVTFVGSGVSLTNPVGLKSKGQGYATFIERKLNTSNYFLLGNTRA